MLGTLPDATQEGWTPPARPHGADGPPAHGDWWQAKKSRKAVSNSREKNNQDTERRVAKAGHRFFSFLNFYFEGMMDSQEIARMIQRDPVYPSLADGYT